MRPSGESAGGAAALLEVRGLVKRFGGLLATDHVDLDVRRGEIHALIGPNGAGKTTLVAQLGGQLPSDAGRIVFEGTDITGWPTHRRAQGGLVRSFQITRLFSSASVLENMALAVQAVSGSSLPAWRPVRCEAALFARAREVLEQVGLIAKAELPIDRLSHGERRALEVGMTIASRPRLVLLDEPMAGMGPEESARMERLIGSVRTTSTVLLIEHDVDAVFRLADRVSVLVEGRIIATGTPAEVRNDPGVIAAYLGEATTAEATGKAHQTAGLGRPSIPAALHQPAHPPAVAPDAPADVARRSLLDLRDVHAGYGSSEVLFGIDLAVHAGEIIGVLGRNGMGKTTLVRVIMGLLRPTAGRIDFAGQSVAGLPANLIARAGIGLVPEGRQVFANLNVEEHLTAFARASPTGVRAWTPRRALELFPRLAERRKHLGSQLSGGEQQMLAIARALVTNPQLLILDEATEGLAPMVREEIWHALGELRRAGHAMIVIDKYVERLVAIADRNVIIEKGRIVWRGTSAALDADREVWARFLGV